MTDVMPVLDVRGLEKHFGGVVAARDINVTVGAGEQIAIVGSNGAGKTTFVNMVTGYLKPSGGTIRFRGQDVTGLDPRQTARAGIRRAEAEGWLPADHPLLAALAQVRRGYGPQAYPGSPLIAAHFLRRGDSAHLAELHPAEHEALSHVAGFATLHRQDGFQMAQAVCPPTPRRGLILIDPSYEVKADYTAIPRQIGLIARKWNVGVIALWYPILTDNRHAPMLDALAAAHPHALRSEVAFAPARPGHSMAGSGMWVLNAPFGLDGQAARIEAIFRRAA